MSHAPREKNRLRPAFFVQHGLCHRISYRIPAGFRQESYRVPIGFLYDCRGPGFEPIDGDDDEMMMMLTLMTPMMIMLMPMMLTMMI